MNRPVESMFRAVQYIEAHLQSETDIAQIAEAVGYSLFYFIRTFDQVVQHTPYDYLMRRRLTEAALTLADTDRRIIDVAQDFCFNNHETFSRAFKRLFGVQPSEWRQKNLAKTTLLMPAKTLEDLHFTAQEHFQYPTIVTFTESTLCGFMIPLDEDPRIQQEQRSRLLADLRELLIEKSTGQWVGVTACTNRTRNRIYYFAGVEKKYALPGLAEYTLPAKRYARIMLHEGNIRPALNYIYFTWCPKVRLRPVCDMVIECFPASGQEAEAVFIPVQ